MKGRAGLWEAAGAGAAIGGTAVWALAVAARFGVLRLLLEAFPRAAWDTVAWGLIPVLLLAPSVVQGAAIAWLCGGRPVPLWRAIVGGVVGALAAMAVFGAAVLDGVRRLPPRTAAVLAKTGPDALIVMFVALIGAGWLIVLGRLLRQHWLGRLALPLALLLVAIVWREARGSVVALSYVLDRPEADGFFAAVAVGGAVGAAWAARPGQTDAGGPRKGGA